MIYFFTKKQLENRLSAKRVKRVYDDNRDGNADSDPINQLRADATSKVRSYLAPMGIMPALEALFDQVTGELLTDKILPEEVVRLALDQAHVYAAQRFPEQWKLDWLVMQKQVDKELCDLRDGKTSLGGGFQGGVATPETSLHGGVVGVPGADPEAQRSNDPCVIGGKWSDLGDYG